MTPTPGRRRVLIVCGYLPYPPTWGAAMRVYQLVRELAASCDVTLLCQRTPDQDASAGDLERVCERVVVVTRSRPAGSARRLEQARSLLSTHPFHAVISVGQELQAALDECLARDRFDLVQLESSVLGLLRLPPGLPVVVDEHNVESEVLLRASREERSVWRRAFNGVEARKAHRLEERTWQAAAGCAVPAPRDATVVQARAPRTPTAVVPNAVDPDFFHPRTPVRTTGGAGLLFVGLLHYRPNVDAVRHFVEQVLPEVQRRRPDALLTVVGAGPPSELDWLRRRGVLATGLVPDVREHLDRASCVVVPVRFGGGTRLKVLEALAMARPLVSTTLGAEGIDVRNGEHLLLADDDDHFAGSVCAVLDDPELGRRLGRAGRARVVEFYSWRAAGEQLAALHNAVVSAPPASTGQTVDEGA